MSFFFIFYLDQDIIIGSLLHFADFFNLVRWLFLELKTGFGGKKLHLLNYFFPPPKHLRMRPAGGV